MALEQSIVEKIKKVNFIDISNSTYEANKAELLNLSKTNKNIMFVHDNTKNGDFILVRGVAYGNNPFKNLNVNGQSITSLDGLASAIKGPLTNDINDIKNVLKLNGSPVSNMDAVVTAAKNGVKPDIDALKAKVDTTTAGAVTLKGDDNNKIVVSGEGVNVTTTAGKKFLVNGHDYEALYKHVYGDASQQAQGVIDTLQEIYQWFATQSGGQSSLNSLAAQVNTNKEKSESNTTEISKVKEQLEWLIIQ